MSNSKILRAAEESIDIYALIRRQDEIEKELQQLRDMYGQMKVSNEMSIERIYDRINKLERELADLRIALTEVKETVDSVHSTVIVVEKHVSEINVKQDVAIHAQDRFIGQLWKAFFALLGIITIAGGAIFTFG